MSGQWWAKTRVAGVLISENQIVSPPVACSTARSRPPYPENSDPILTGQASERQWCMRWLRMSS